jgi:Subtilase family
MTIEDSPAESGSWEGRVAFSEQGPAGGFAYRPAQLVAIGEDNRDRALSRLPTLVPPEQVGTSYVFTIPAEVVATDTLSTIMELRSEGMAVHPNHVLFADTCWCCPPHPAHAGAAYADPVRANPVWATSVWANPVWATSVWANPVWATSVRANPVWATPAYAIEYRRTGRRESSARPCTAPAGAARSVPATGTTGPTVAVLDTGLASEAYRPAALAYLKVEERHSEVPDEDSDHLLDPVAGHGTFITGLIQSIAPGTEVLAVRVLSAFGDGDEAAIALAIDGLPEDVAILNLSFSGYALESMYTLAGAVRRFQQRPGRPVVVASAGNDGTCRPTYPAVLDGVVAVGAVGPEGPAPFSNYGPWVDACAPGVEIASTFFTRFNGLEAFRPGGTDPDLFDGCATWSGTSFSAPIVAAALAREMQGGSSARQAVERIVEAPGLLRIPNLGTVVNVL